MAWNRTVSARKLTEADHPFPCSPHHFPKNCFRGLGGLLGIAWDSGEGKSPRGNLCECRCTAFTVTMSCANTQCQTQSLQQRYIYVLHILHQLLTATISCYRQCVGLHDLVGPFQLCFCEHSIVIQIFQFAQCSRSPEIYSSQTENRLLFFKHQIHNLFLFRIFRYCFATKGSSRC